MDCPRCDTGLREGGHAGVRAFVCERCAGCLLERRKLITVLDVLAYELAASVGPNTVLPPTPGPEAEIDCPACTAEMERYGYMGSRQVMIDGCDPCEWLWLDAGELLAMARLHVRHDRRTESRQMSSRPADLVGLQMTTRATEAALLGSASLLLTSLFFS